MAGINYNVSELRKRNINISVASKKPEPNINNNEVKKEEEMVNVLDTYFSRKINYKELRKKCLFKIVNNEEVDVSVIVPVTGRDNFTRVLLDHLEASMEKYPEKKYSITFVEHSHAPSHLVHCEGRCNYIYLKREQSEFFNKCLAMNMGALFSNKAKNYMFHDLDLIMDKDFFSKIFENLSKIDPGSALQTFSGRKVVVLDGKNTSDLIHGTIKISNIIPGKEGSAYCTPGAPGGSIFIPSDSYFKVGGFDAEFFHSYSCEDSFFYNKLLDSVGISGCESPKIDLFHMDHPRLNGRDNPDTKEQMGIFNSFCSMEPYKRKEIIEKISKSFIENLI